MIDLRRGYEPLRAEILAAMARVCDAQQFILGPEVAAFEKEAAAFLGTRGVIGCASGTDALWLALAALGIGPGDRVITTPYTFFATVSAIVRTRARPVLVDIDPATFNLDPAAVASRLASCDRVKAILPVHLYGQCADLTAFAGLAANHCLKIVEDAAQAFGATWEGRLAGSLGDAAAFSFYPTKNLSAMGDAGCLTAGNDAILERAHMLRNHGSRRRYHHEEVGANSRLDGVQAAVLRIKLRHLVAWNDARRERAAAYDRLFTAAGLVAGKTGVSAATPVILPFRDPRAGHIFHQYVIRTHRRDELRQFLTAHGIGSEVFYPVPLHLQPAFTFLGIEKGALPCAERAAQEVLALPMFPELTEEEQQRVVGAIAEFYG
jgi:dTDP-4-amino-4,6-dideoxygalactose transaminase